jgi:FkbM family methyltransferase
MQIGASRGEYSFMASRVIEPRGLCIALEPNPVAYLDLLELIVLNKASNVLALPAACGNTKGWVELELPAEEWGDGVVRVKTQAEHGARVVARARLCRVDGIVRGLGLERCDFLIIDVEGYEGEVLRGGGCGAAAVSASVIHRDTRHLGRNRRNFTDVWVYSSCMEGESARKGTSLGDAGVRA